MFQALLAGAGLAFQAYGAYSQYQTSKQAAGINQNIASTESAIEAERMKQMRLNSRRQQVENIRNTQLAQSMALNSAVNQGASQGSGYYGGQAQITGQGLYNSLGITQNTQIGEAIFGYNSQISQYKQQLASLGSQSALASGISQLGGNMLSIGASFGGNPFMTGNSGGNTQGNSVVPYNFNGNRIGALY